MIRKNRPIFPGLVLITLPVPIPRPDISSNLGIGVSLIFTGLRASIASRNGTRGIVRHYRRLGLSPTQRCFFRVILKSLVGVGVLLRSSLATDRSGRRPFLLETIRWHMVSWRLL